MSRLEAVFEGNVAGNTPRHKASLWTIYQFDERVLDGLEVGVGLTTSSNFFDHSNEIKAPGYTTVDAGLRYAINDNVEVSLHGRNLFDTKYYQRLGGTISNDHYGEPRTVLLQFKGRM